MPIYLELHTKAPNLLLVKSSVNRGMDPARMTSCIGVHHSITLEELEEHFRILKEHYARQERQQVSESSESK